MAAAELLLERVRAALKRAPDVEEKKMFGGLMFMVRGKMCISVRPERLMCRIDPAIHDAAVKRNGCRTMTMKGREYRGYVHVDRDAVKSSRDLSYWVDLALDYNARFEAPAKRATKPTRVRRRRVAPA